jgi:hypothetical protein
MVPSFLQQAVIDFLVQVETQAHAFITKFKDVRRRNTLYSA